jgi:hypothetical protein
MPSEWNLRYERFVIEDGYPDREVGESFNWFAVEFWAEGQLVAANRVNEITATPVGDFLYRVTAKIAYVSEKVAVIDFGIRAIGARDLLPSDCKDGDFVTGDIAIGIPLSIDIVPEDVVQTLKNSWQINRISADLTPYISHPDDSTGKWQIRDTSRIRYEQVSSTRTTVAPSHVLHCSEASTPG